MSFDVIAKTAVFHKENKKIYFPIYIILYFQKFFKDFDNFLQQNIANILDKTHFFVYNLETNSKFRMVNYV